MTNQPDDRMTRLWPSPLGFRRSSPMIDGPRHHKQQIGEPVDVPNQDQVDWRPQRHHPALCAAADRAGKMQPGAGLDAAGKNKMRERRQLGFEPIDELLEALDIRVVKHRLRDAGRNLFGRIGEPGAKGKQIALNLRERVADVCEGAVVRASAERGARKTEPGVELVDLAVRVDAGVALRDAGAAEERCFTRVAGARIDFHGMEDGRFII